MSGSVLDMTEEVLLRPPREDEVAELRELCVRSKASWGYDAAFLELCRESLGVDMELARNGFCMVAEIGGRAAGVAQIMVHRPNAQLDLLFVDPENFHRSVGRELLKWASRTARAHGATVLRILSDPGARAFYVRQGARHVGDVPSDAVPGRHLPLMVLDLTEYG